MKMNRCTAAILLMLSLEALFAGRLSAAVADDGTIRLPSQDNNVVAALADKLSSASSWIYIHDDAGLAVEIVTAAVRESGRKMKLPWDCCRSRSPADCGFILPPCLGNGDGDGDVSNGVGVAGHGDKGKLAGPPSWCCLNIECQLKFKFPLCSSHNGVRNGGPGVAGHADEGTAAAAVGRPCCAWDNTGCRFTLPPCPVGSGDDARNDEAASEKSLAGAADGEVVGARPWKCCDLPLCTKTFPPTCRCLDKVKRCAKTCKVCEKADASNGAAAAPSYVCRDWYGGWAGPSCTKPPVAADVRPGN